MDLIVPPLGPALYRGRAIPCAIGRGGLTGAKKEGDGGTPRGAWRIESGFWRADRLARPSTAVPMVPSGPRMGWCDAPGHPDYNQQVRLPFEASHERMRRGDRLYDVVLVLDHNRHPPVPGAGSAIFVHCWRGPRRPTEGCIAFARPDLLWILERWDMSRDRVVVR